MKLHFGVKSLKFELFQNEKTEKNFNYDANICMQNGIMHIQVGSMILASIVKELKDFADRQTDGWTAGLTDRWRSVTHNPLFFFEKQGDNDQNGHRLITIVTSTN